MPPAWRDGEGAIAMNNLRLIVIWPDGSETVFPDVNRFVFGYSPDEEKAFMKVPFKEGLSWEFGVSKKEWEDSWDRIYSIGVARLSVN